MQLQMMTSGSQGPAGQPNFITVIFTVRSFGWAVLGRQRFGGLFALAALNESRFDWLRARGEILWDRWHKDPQQRHDTVRADIPGFFMPTVFTYRIGMVDGVDKEEFPDPYFNKHTDIEEAEDETGIRWGEVEWAGVPSSKKRLISDSCRLIVSLVDPARSELIAYRWTGKLTDGGAVVHIGPMLDDEIWGLRNKLLYGSSQIQPTEEGDDDAHDEDE